MSPEPMESDLDRAKVEVAARLRSRGIEASERESPEDLVRLLDAVERFERTVQRRGGDLMVDEPISGEGTRPRQPDNRRFVLPVRRDDESIDAFIARIEQARERATE